MLRIRGHHLLCIAGFRGRGYSEEFIRNMRRVVSAVRNNPQEFFVACEGWDDICRACPHLGPAGCERDDGAEDATRRADRAVLSRIGVEAKQKLPLEEAYLSLAGSVAPSDLEQDLCTDCRWRPLGFCAEGLENLRRGEFFLT